MPDAVYFTAPHRTPWQGQREIVQGWLGRADDQGDWDFRYEMLHVEPLPRGGPLLGYTAVNTEEIRGS
jgi:hypothetical protein